MKIGDKVIAIEGFAGLDFSYGMGDENNPATYIEVTEQNIGYLQDAESIGRVRVVVETPIEQEVENTTMETKTQKRKRK